MTLVVTKFTLRAVNIRAGIDATLKSVPLDLYFSVCISLAAGGMCWSHIYTRWKPAERLGYPDGAHHCRSPYHAMVGHYLRVVLHSRADIISLDARVGLRSGPNVTLIPFLLPQSFRR